MESSGIRHILPATFTSLATQEHYPFVFVIGPSRSANWKTVKRLCAVSPYFQENEEGMLLAAFSFDWKEFEVAYEVMRLAGDWKGSFLFYRGKRITFYYMWQWVHCYKQSLEIENLTAHCIGFYDLSSTRSGTRFAVAYPCRKFAPFTVDVDAPVDFQEQVLTSGQMQGFTLCPNFHIENFKISIR